MKNLNSILSKTIFTAAFAFLLFNGGYAQKGNGNVIKQDRTIEAFNAIDVGGAFEVYIRQGSTEELTVVADDNLLEYITTDVRGGTLDIGLSKSIKNSTELKIYLTVVSLNEIEASGACNIKGKNMLTSTDLSLDISGASNLDLEIDCTNLEIEASGASDAEIGGTATNMEVDASGASTIIATNIKCANAQVDASGASTVKIAVTDNLECESSGASSVLYKGNPHVSVDVSGAGTVKKM